MARPTRASSARRSQNSAMPTPEEGGPFDTIQTILEEDMVSINLDTDESSIQEQPQAPVKIKKSRIEPFSESREEFGEVLVNIILQTSSLNNIKFADKKYVFKNCISHDLIPYQPQICVK